MAGSARVTGAYLLCCLVFAFAAIRSSSASSYELQVRVTKDDIIFSCRFYIHKKMGSPFPPADSNCCEDVRNANVVQICQEFTEADKAWIAVWKWAQITRKCQNPLPAGHDCAGYICAMS
ncbi:unnamed protein product [Urochloa humidicola]